MLSDFKVPVSQVTAVQIFLLPSPVTVPVINNYSKKCMSGRTYINFKVDIKIISSIA
jgi:hypothetical protein